MASSRAGQTTFSTHQPHWRHSTISKHVIYERDNNINKHNLTTTLPMIAVGSPASELGNRFSCCRCCCDCVVMLWIWGEIWQCPGHAPNISAYLIFKYGWLIDNDHLDGGAAAQTGHYIHHLNDITFRWKVMVAPALHINGWELSTYMFCSGFCCNLSRATSISHDIDCHLVKH